jgi:hypothetical protein
MAAPHPTGGFKTPRPIRALASFNPRLNRCVNVGQLQDGRAGDGWVVRGWVMEFKIRPSGEAAIAPEAVGTRRADRRRETLARSAAEGTARVTVARRAAGSRPEELRAVARGDAQGPNCREPDGLRRTRGCLCCLYEGRSSVARERQQRTTCDSRVESSENLPHRWWAQTEASSGWSSFQPASSKKP